MKSIWTQKTGLMIVTMILIGMSVGCTRPIIYNVEPSEAYVGEEIAISAVGFYLGYSQPEDTTITVGGVDAGRATWWMCYGGAVCDIWVEVPEGAESGCVVIHDELIGESNCYPLTILED